MDSKIVSSTYKMIDTNISEFLNGYFKYFKMIELILFINIYSFNWVWKNAIYHGNFPFYYK
jgi:hypothetical protein